MDENIDPRRRNEDINQNFQRKKKDLSKVTNFVTMYTDDDMTIFILPDPDYT